jgi:aminopeptidase
MNDPRVNQLAKILVRYCLAAKSKETVGVLGSTLATPLVVAVYEELLRVGAFPAVKMLPDELEDTLYRLGKPHHFTMLSPYERAFARSVDSTIGIHAQGNTRALSGVDPRKQTMRAKTAKSVQAILRKKPWVLTVFPTQAYAQDAEMSLGDYEDFVYGATFADEDNPVKAWRSLGRMQDRLIARLKGTDKVRIVGKDTDLTMSVKGRPFINSDGRHNMPSGEVFAGPIENSANGYIKYDFPVCPAGREIEGVRLVFRDGVVVEATAEKNQKYLATVLDADRGARRIGELGIGTNTKITKFTRHILFDEKIAGTIHIALGKSILESGGTNQSAIHWDMIKDLRKGGAIYLDGKLFQKNGKFV